jgi:3-hydroxyacyl-[acyl-carrier-protein] dehydratase
MTTQPAATLHGPMEISAEHPAFAGHFPKFPVLPGAVLIDAALSAIAAAHGLDLRQWHLASVKFLDMVRPGDVLSLEHGGPVNGSIRFTIRVADRKAVSGTLSHAPAQGDSACRTRP